MVDVFCTIESDGPTVLAPRPGFPSAFRKILGITTYSFHPHPALIYKVPVDVSALFTSFFPVASSRSQFLASLFSCIAKVSLRKGKIKIIEKGEKKGWKRRAHLLHTTGQQRPTFTPYPLHHQSPPSARPGTLHLAAHPFVGADFARAVEVDPVIRDTRR